jgi:rRNA maturation protein Rpf1
MNSTTDRSIQHPFENSLRWLEEQINQKGVQKTNLDSLLYALKALRLNGRDNPEVVSALFSALKEDLNFKLKVMIDLPQADPEAYLNLIEFSHEYDTKLESELSNSVLDDAKRLQLPDGAILGNHLAFTYLLIHVAPNENTTKLALEYTKKAFEEKVLPDSAKIKPKDMLLYTKILFAKGLLTPEHASTMSFALSKNQKEDGSVGTVEDTIYTFRTLAVLDSVGYSDNIKRAIEFIKTKIDQKGSIDKDLRLTSLFLLGWAEVSQTLSRLNQLLESTEVITSKAAFSVKGIIEATLKKAQTQILMINVTSKNLLEIVLAQLTSKNALSLIYVHSKTLKPELIQNERIKMKQIDMQVAPIILIDKKTLLILPQDQESVFSENCVVLLINDQELARKLAMLFDKE